MGNPAGTRVGPGKRTPTFTPDDPTDYLLSIEATAKWLGLSSWSVRALIERKAIRSVRYPEGRVWVPTSEVRRLIAERARAA